MSEARRNLNGQQKENIKKYVLWGWLDEAVMKATHATKGQVRMIRRDNKLEENKTISTGHDWVEVKKKISKLELPHHSFMWESPREAVRRRKKEKENAGI